MQILGMDLQVFSLPVITANMFVLSSEGKALMIDPQKNEQARSYLSDNDINEITIILTHEHYDHISGVNFFREYSKREGIKCMVYAGSACADALPDPESNLAKYFEVLFMERTEKERKLAEKIFEPDYHCEADIRAGDNFELIWQSLKLIFRKTPGHTPGSICIEMYDDAGNLVALVTGDSLVQGNKVITRLPSGSKRDYREITRPYLESFGPDTLVLPGHGSVSFMRELELG